MKHWPRLAMWIFEESIESARLRFYRDAAIKRHELIGATLLDAQELRNRVNSTLVWAKRYLSTSDEVTTTLEWIDECEARVKSSPAVLEEKRVRDLLNHRVQSVSVGDRFLVLEEMAWAMQNTGQSSLALHEFPAQIPVQLRLDSIGIRRLQEDLRNYLQCDASGRYRIASRSMFHFLVARKLANLLGKGEIANCPLNEVIVKLTNELLAPINHFERRFEGDMAFVPGGPFIFGSELEANLQLASLQDGFWMDRIPVTNQQFCHFLELHGNQDGNGSAWVDFGQSRIRLVSDRFSFEEGFEEHPVTGVSYQGAQAFAAWVGKRLPTELEWEKAARGIDGRTYPWGEVFNAEACNTSESGPGRTTPVGTYGDVGRSIYGCDDMVGNVWEWTSTAWPKAPEYFAARGGSWKDARSRALCSCRYIYPMNYRENVLGFRCCR